MQLSLYFKRLSDFVDKIVKYIVFAIIVSMIIIITLQIICRVLFTALTWSEELSRYLLVWGSFFASTMAYKRSAHISVTFVVDLFPKGIKKFIIILGIILSMIFFAVALIYGVKLMAVQAVQVSAALRIPMRWIYVAMPISFIIMMIHGISNVLEQLFSREEAKA